MVRMVVMVAAKGPIVIVPAEMVILSQDGLKVSTGS